MNIELIETILTASKCTSFLEASYALNYTPAVVSKHIMKAEKELGVKLFNRGNKSNSISLTPECILIIEDLSEILKHYQHARNTLSALSDPSHNSTVRIGISHRNSHFGETEIISDFIVHNPNISLEQTRGYSADLLHMLELFQLDAVFITCQGKAADFDWLQEYIDTKDFDFFEIDSINQMYLAISSNSKLARKSEASFTEFADYYIAFNSDRKARLCSRNKECFTRLCEQYGFPLKSIALPTVEPSVFAVAQQMNVAVPVPMPDSQIEGISYVRLTDWDLPLTAYFVTCNMHHRQSTIKFKKSVSAYRLNKECKLCGGD